MTSDGTDRKSDDASAESTDSGDDSLAIPRVPTEDAGSGFWADLRANSTDESIEMPGNAGDAGDSGEASGPDEVSTEIDGVDLSDVPDDLIRTFVAVVVAINAAVLAVSLGLLFLVFEGAVTRSAILLGGGVVCFGLAVRRYRRYQSSRDEDATDEDALDDETDGERPEADEDAPESDTETATGTRSGSSRSDETSSNEVAEHRSPDDADPS